MFNGGILLWSYYLTGRCPNIRQKQKKTAQLICRKQRYHKIDLTADLDIKPAWVNIFIVVFYLVSFPQTSARMTRPDGKNLQYPPTEGGWGGGRRRPLNEASLRWWSSPPRILWYSLSQCFPGFLGRQKGARRSGMQ